jgi:hypothetical protein
MMSNNYLKYLGLNLPPTSSGARLGQIPCPGGDRDDAWISTFNTNKMSVAFPLDDKRQTHQLS